VRIAETLVLALGLYVALGALFAIWFSAGGARRIDASVKGSSIGFRALVAPGAAALWPLLIVWVARGRSNAAPETIRPRETRAGEEASS